MLQQIRQYMGDQVENYDFSCYPMDCETFIDMMSNSILRWAVDRKWDFEQLMENLNEEDIQDFDKIVCEEFKSRS